MVIGYPPSRRRILERHVGSRATVAGLWLSEQIRPLRLQLKPAIARLVLEQKAEEATDYDNLAVVILPYCTIPGEVIESVDLLEEFGSKVFKPEKSSHGWPAQPKKGKFDRNFGGQLDAKLFELLDEILPEVAKLPEGEAKAAVDVRDDDSELIKIAEELVRGLARHSKMGPNNHSSEEDMLKGRGQQLGPGGKKTVIKLLLTSGIVCRKENASIGGTGWVYWICDVEKAKATYPDLASYFI